MCDQLRCKRWKYLGPRLQKREETNTAAFQSAHFRRGRRSKVHCTTFSFKNASKPHMRHSKVAIRESIRNGTARGTARGTAPIWAPPFPKSRTSSKSENREYRGLRALKQHWSSTEVEARTAANDVIWCNYICTSQEQRKNGTFRSWNRGVIRLLGHGWWTTITLVTPSLVTHPARITGGPSSGASTKDKGKQVNKTWLQAVSFSSTNAPWTKMVPWFSCCVLLFYILEFSGGLSGPCATSWYCQVSIARELAASSPGQARNRFGTALCFDGPL